MKKFKLSSAALSVAMCMHGGAALASDLPIWDGTTHYDAGAGGSITGYPFVVDFGGVEMTAAWYVDGAPDLGPEYPNIQELYAQNPDDSLVRQFIFWCPGATAPGSPDFVEGFPDYTSPWSRSGGASTTSASCEESYLALHGGDDGGEPEEETSTLVMDAKSIETHEINGFDPTGGSIVDDEKQNYLSKTSSRVMKHLSNEYERTTDQKVSAYITDWSQYDARISNPNVDSNGDGKVDLSESGRGFDLQRMIDNPTMFDVLIFSFMGICGDTGTNAATISSHCTGAFNGGEDSENGEVILVDHWGDMASQVNTGTPGNFDISPTNWKSFIGNDTAVGGALGGMFAVQDAARARGHELELALSIGGWSMSGYFSEVAKTPELRANFVNSVVEFAAAWNDGEQKRFHRIDIDWEYPGFGPEGSSCSTCSEDGENYVTLLQQLREVLDSNPHTQGMKITVATVGVPEKMAEMEPVFASNIVDDYFVMTYDFWGTGWADNLDHHSNLYRGENSADEAIQYIAGLGVPKSKIHVGYAGYGRSGAGVTDFANKQYDKTAKAVGTFENGAPEMADLVFNWLDLGDNPETSPSGKNDFSLITDFSAQAQLLYNETTNNIISLDTPTTVKAKAKYAKEQGLGGIFSWAGDQENGMLANAAHEGLGHTAKGDLVWDMAQSYGCGQGIVEWGNPEAYQELTEAESDAVCKGVFEKDYSGYKRIHSSDTNTMSNLLGDNKPAVGQTITMKVKQAGETLFVAAGSIRDNSHNEGVYDYTRILAQGYGGTVLPLYKVNGDDHYARFIYGHRNSSGFINPKSVPASNYKNGLYCAYDCEDITVEYGKIPEVYNVEKQVSGPSVEPGTTMRLVATLGEEEVYRSEFVTNDYHNLSYRWPDMLCSQGIQKDFAEEQAQIAAGEQVDGLVLACGEMSGINKVETINGTNYRNYVWSNNPHVTVTIEAVK
ncbi:Putative chitinase [Vibrio sinaloensis DSM 21326]|uniref:chitinase n=1 Tax=Vibrio sinaloensis DSM 21326 TaxID=945550 RepID=E8M423_PHOS4|nr:glycosyl hydrolase family 18 protein [Vibrio sinaloensis]EGA71206.1 Putative chitinase [Vibrio sinaloensis DSM 21326]